MESILIKVPPQLDSPAEWVVIDHNGHPHAAIRSGSLSAVGSQSHHRQIMALVPTIDLVINEVGFPSKNRRKFRQAVPYMLEDQFAEEVDTLHFAVGSFKQTEDHLDTALKIPVATVQQEKLDEWLSQFEASNMQPKVLMPDVLALPFEKGTWSILINDDISLIRTGLSSGFACDSCNLAIMIDASLDKLKEAEPPAKLVIWDYTQNEETESTEANLNLEHDIEIDYQAVDIDPISLMARGIHQNGKPNTALNLLQGEYSRQEEYGKFIRPWRTAAVILVVLVALSFTSKLIELNRLQSQEKALFSEMQNIYKSNFPKARNLSQPELFMKQKLKAMGVDSKGGGSQFFIYLTAISETLPRHQATLKSISYNKQQLDVELEISSVQALDQLKAEIASKYSLSVDINAATPEDGKVLSRLRLKEASS